MLLELNLEKGMINDHDDHERPEARKEDAGMPDRMMLRIFLVGVCSSANSSGRVPASHFYGSRIALCDEESFLGDVVPRSIEGRKVIKLANHHSARQRRNHYDERQMP